MSLRALFEAIASGATAVARTELARAMSPGELEALRAARVVTAGPPFRDWPCERGGAECGREVEETPPGATTAFVAVCGGSREEEDRCGDVPLTADDLARARIDLRELARALRGLYRVEGPGLALAAEGPPGEPVRLGEERTDARTRDVFLVLRPARAGLPAFLEARERVGRATLVLTPTAGSLSAALVARHAAGAHVEVEVLEDAIVVRDDRLVRAPRPRLVAAPAEPIAPVGGDTTTGGGGDGDAGAVAPGGIAAQLGVRQFADLAIRAIDGHTVRLVHKRRYVHATYVDLGFGTKRRNPCSEWALLLDVCAGHGQFRWKKYKSMNNAKVRVSRLQTKLRAALGLQDDAFHKFRVVDGWRAKFFASSDIADDTE